jgi:two-component system NtrC family sensor kinase
VGKGAGLGLSICYGIIEKMGGKIEVQSKVGSGTTFLIYIPLQTKAGLQGEKNESGLDS